MLPKLSGGDGINKDDETAWIVEGLYKFPISNQLEITPGAYVIFNPDGDGDADEVIVGVIRTTFKF